MPNGFIFVKPVYLIVLSIQMFSGFCGSFHLMTQKKKKSLEDLVKLRALGGKTNTPREINGRTVAMQEPWGAGSGPVVSKTEATEQIAANAQISACSLQTNIKNQM